MISSEKKLGLMRMAIKLAEQSTDADGRVHPKVGAVLANPDGDVVFTSYRGEDKPGQHAEFVLFEKARQAEIDTTGMHLFVTLEPCTRRGLNKTPCAARVAESRVSSVHIGTLDPNPHITGRGELFLSSHTEVERFPGPLARELAVLNADFFGQHMHEHVPSISPYAGGSGAGIRPRLASQREALLQQSMDLITGTEGTVWSLGGGLTWLREMQIGFLYAALEGRKVRLVCNPKAAEAEGFERSVHAANAMGADVAVSERPFALRGTIVASRAEDSAAICIEKSPDLHGHLFRAPHDRGVLTSITSFVESIWEKATKYDRLEPAIDELEEAWLQSSLVEEIPAYATAKAEIVEVSVSDLLFLPKALERFKLFRLSQLAALRERHNLPLAFALRGSPWPVIPPIVERQPDGTMVIIDGAHRAYSALTRNQHKIRVLLITGAAAPLPARPQAGIDNIALHFERLPRNQRYEGLSEHWFRPVREGLARALRKRWQLGM